MILKTGEIVTVPMAVEVLAPFAFEDRIYYITKPICSIADTIWLLSSDGLALDPTPELLERAGQALEQLESLEEE